MTEVELQLPEGLHSRPCHRLAQISRGFQSDIKLSNLTRGNAGDELNAKDVFDLLTLAGVPGDIVRVRCLGEDARSAGLTIAKFLSNSDTATTDDFD